MTEPVAPPETTAPRSLDPQRVEEARKILTELLGLLELPARIELQDAPDGGIAVALHVDGELQGLANGKRNNVIDSLQFLANKILNKPNQERRWITLGLGGFPEPRTPKAPRPPQGQAPIAAVPVAAAVAQQAVAAAPRAPKPGRQGQGQPGGGKPQSSPDEHSLEVAEDPAFAQAVRALAEKSAALGRFYAIAPLKQEDRARVVKASAGVAGMRALLEGEGRGRRVVLTPDKPTPMPKLSVMPDFDDEEDEEA